MNTHTVSVSSRSFPLPSSGRKPSIDAKLDRVFQMAEHVDARCVYMLDAASQRRRQAIAIR